MSEILCGGACCRKFYTPYSPAEWKRKAFAIRYKQPTWVSDNGTVYLQNAKNPEDILYIADMLIPLPTEQGSIVGLLNTSHPYTCKHLVNGLCSDYEQRPKMCSGYPDYNNDGTKCNYKDCQCLS